MSNRLLFLIFFLLIFLSVFSYGVESDANVVDSNKSVLDLNVGDSNKSIGDINADSIKQLDVNAGTDLNKAIDLNAGKNDVNVAVDLNTPKQDVNVLVDVNAGVDVDALAKDLNALDKNVLDANAPDKNVLLDVNAPSDQNKGATAVPDFNFFRLVDSNSSIYLGAFEKTFLLGIKAFVDSVLARSLGAGVQAIEAHDANLNIADSNAALVVDSLYIVPDKNFFASVDANSPGLGLVKGFKEILDSFLSITGVAEEEQEPLKEKQVIVNGLVARCFGVACENLPAVVK